MSRGTLKPATPPRFPSLQVKDGVIQETGEPASVKKVNQLLGWSSGIVIDVWNCRAELCRVVHLEHGYTFKDIEFKPPLTERQRQRLDEVLEHEIWRQGGAINMSGQYRISQASLNQIARLIGKRRLQRVCMAGKN